MAVIGEGFIDLHHHVVPDFFRDEVAATIAAGSGGGRAPLQLPAWSPSAALGVMDAGRVALGVASSSFPVHFGDDAAARRLARRMNEFIADLVRDNPTRFAGLAILPLPDVDGALEELAYAFDVLHLDGVVLMTNHGGVYLGDQRFDAIFEQLQARGALAFVHPDSSPDPTAHALGLPDFLIDFTADTTRAIAKLHYSDTFVRTPDVRYVFSHAGGTVPYLTTRFELLDSLQFMPGHEQRPSATEMFRRLYWDTALAFTGPVVQLLRQVVGDSQIVYGSDYPFDDPARSTPRFSDPEQTEPALSQAIARTNALRLLPRLA